MSNFWFDFGSIVLRSIGSLLLLFILAKLMGPRQMAQLTFYDYVIGISIGSIAATMALDANVPFYHPLTAMVIYALIAVGMGRMTLKSIKARRLLAGTPTVLICKGKILEHNLRRQKYDLNELLSSCRVNGYFDLTELEYVIMEGNGALSFLPKSENAPLTPGDMSLQVTPATLQANVVVDGNIMQQHLAAIGRDEGWLHKKLGEQNCADLSQILLAVGDSNGDLTVFGKNEPIAATNYFD